MVKVHATNREDAPAVCARAVLMGLDEFTVRLTTQPRLLVGIHKKRGLLPPLLYPSLNDLFDFADDTIKESRETHGDIINL